MSKRYAIVGLVAAGLVLLAVWIARHTYWGEIEVPMPLRGEAARNPVYAAQHFAEALGAHTQRTEGLELPGTDAVIVLRAWSWDVSNTRRERMEQWVEGGGRLVVDRSLLMGSDAFADWSGIHLVVEDAPNEPFQIPDPRVPPPPPCEELIEIGPYGDLAEDDGARTYEVCRFVRGSYFDAGERVEWGLRDGSDDQVVRVAVGKGTVTAINAQPFVRRELFEGDHAALFVAATQLRAGDEVVFLSEEDHTSLLGLIWRNGAPVVVLCAVLLALALWRGGARFGPLTAAADAARRSLAEQIRGTGQFALRFGGGESLRAATERALSEAAAQRIPGYARSAGAERAAALARATGFDAAALERALAPSGPRPPELRSVIALLEAARRKILHDNERAKHGKRFEHDHSRG
jgi:hypothetical protein